jgi:hypothetical protein
MKRMKNLLGIVGIVLGLAVIAPLSQKVYATTPWQKLTQAELTAVWWQWLFSIPASESPVLDDTGANAYSGQPYSTLLFLAGTFISDQLPNGDVLGKVTRSISLKSGTALFFPLINSDNDNVCFRPNLGGNCFGAETFPHNLGVPQLQAVAAAQQDSVVGLHATLTPADQNFNQIRGPASVVYTRLQPHPFSYKLPAHDNLLQYQGVDVSGTVAPAVADGYFSLVPLGTIASGYYVLRFGGSVPFTNNTGTHLFTEDITYHITVIP